MKSQWKSGDDVSHVVKVLLFHPSVRTLSHVSVFKPFPCVLFQLQDCDLTSSAKRPGLSSSFKQFETERSFLKVGLRKNFFAAKLKSNEMCCKTAGGNVLACGSKRLYEYLSFSHSSSLSVQPRLQAP